ncbi:MAG: mechanosensitive ion channel [Nodosilinea sp.]
MVSIGALAQVNWQNPFLDQAATSAGKFIPSLIGAIAILVVGWLVATLVAFLVKSLLNRLQVDRRLSGLGNAGGLQAQEFPVTQWASTLVFWVIFLFAIVASLNALNLTAVSTPLNAFLDQIFIYLPKVGGALLLLGLGWIVATLVRSLVNSSLGRLNLDQRLSDQAGLSPGDNPVVLHETIGNILFWFILLLFVPLVLNALQLPGLLTPIQGLINSFLQAVPRIITAAIILALGWIIARIVRGVVTNLLVAVGADQVAPRLGLKTSGPGSLSLSGLAGTLAYVLVLIPALIAALNELKIDAISGPAIAMLEQVITAIPQIIMAGVVVAVAYFIGQFLANLVTELLRSAGFDNILGVLGLPELSLGHNAPPASEWGAEESAPARRQGPSEIAGIVTLVAVVLFGAVMATEILNFPALTEIVRAILRIGARVLSGVVVFALGLYLANLAFRLVNAMGTSQAKVLAQAARIAVITFSGAMALQQMGVATDIVNLAFGLLLGAIAVAIAIAFGLGGRDVASEQIREWLSGFRQR